MRRNSIRAGYRPAIASPPMRFGIKTAPQHTTWDAMLEVFRAADDIELFESGWTFDHFYPIFSDPTGPCFEGWTLTTALGQARCEPKPLQRPHPPICVGGSGEKRTLPIAARYAQHWNFVAGPPEQLAHKRDVLHAACADIGRDPAEITVSVQVFCGADQDAKEVAEQAASYAEAGANLAIIGLAPPHRAATLEPLADALAPLAG